MVTFSGVKIDFRQLFFPSMIFYSLGEFELFEISGCLKFIVSYFATGVRRKCLQGDNCEGAANLCFPVSRPMLVSKFPLQFDQK